MRRNSMLLRLAAGVLLGIVALMALAALAWHAPWVLAALVVLAGAAGLSAALLRSPPRRRYPLPPSAEEALGLPDEDAPRSYPAAGSARGDWLRVLIVGLTGQGKTWLGLSLLYTVVFGGMRNLARILGVSPHLREQYRAAVGHEKTERTISTYTVSEQGAEGVEASALPNTIDGVPMPAERLLLRLRDRVIEFLFWAGEDLYLDDGWLDIDGLMERMAVVGAQRVIVVTNPFKMDGKRDGLGHRALLDLACHFFEKGYPLGRAVELAAEQMFGIDRKGLVKMRVGYQRLGEGLRDARVRFEVTGRKVRDQFVIEGVSPAVAARIHDVLERMAVTVVEQAVEANVVAEVAARLGPRCVVVGTHADLLPFLRTVGELDLRKVLQKAFPPGRSLRATQVVVQGSIRLETSTDPKEPVWVRGPSPTATELLESIGAELGVLVEVDRGPDELAAAAPAPVLPLHALLPISSRNGTRPSAVEERGGVS